MAPTLPLLRSFLYAPANRARFIEKAFLVGADAVVLDLEDAVPAGEKETARAMAAEAVAGRAGKSGAVVLVRVNGLDTGLTRDDVLAVVRPGLSAVRVPKVEDAESVRQVAAWMDEAERAHGMPAGSVAINCTLESGAGIWRARDIATAHPRVRLLGLGLADYLTDLGGQPEIDQLDLATVYARSHMALASRVAGLNPPVDTVWATVDDLVSLEHFARQARALGFFGKAAIHPKQVDVINRVFTPSESEVAYARKVIATYEEAESRGAGSVFLGKDEMIDVAHVKRARNLLTLVDGLAERGLGAG